VKRPKERLVSQDLSRSPGQQRRQETCTDNKREDPAPSQRSRVLSHREGTVDRPEHCSAPADDEALRQVPRDWKDGYNNGNAAKVAALYTEDAYYLTQHFVTASCTAAPPCRPTCSAASTPTITSTIEVVMTECHGDFAYTVTRYESTNAGQKAFGVNLVVLRKVRGKWLIVAHESAVSEPTTAIQTLDVR
jgi:ketosteroid isomerase-like protein